MKKNSIWEEYVNISYKKLDNNLKCDVLIIGGGIAGILTNYYLKDSNLNIILVERNELLKGVTSKMTAKVTPLQDILTKINKNDLSLYIKSQLKGIELLKENIKTLNIECDLKENDSYLYTNQSNNIKKIKKLESILNKLNIPIKKENIPIKELKSLYSIKTNLSYEFNPIKYLNGILKEIKNDIYQNTSIIKVIKENSYYLCLTNNHKQIKAKKVIFATNYPYFLKPLFFPLKVKLEKSRIKYGDSSYSGTYNLINIDKDVYSIRFYNNRMIYLDNNYYLSHYKNKIGNTPLLKEIDNYWTNMDVITNDYLPIAGQIDKNMYIITGFNTWGILSSHIGAKLLNNLILNKKEYLCYEKIFNPRKKINVKKVLNSFINIYESLNGYLKGLIKSQDKNICPHLGCYLIYNKIEDTWDCPCHGSRFTKDGKVISGPAIKTCKVKKKL